MKLHQERTSSRPWVAEEEDRPVAQAPGQRGHRGRVQPHCGAGRRPEAGARSLRAALGESSPRTSCPQKAKPESHWVRSGASLWRTAHPCDSAEQSWTGRRERKKGRRRKRQTTLRMAKSWGALPAPPWCSLLFSRPELSPSQFPSNGDTHPLPAHRWVHP